ncbi:unnamed protein product [Polarella glacialis]|uniref:Uncharacterized protein n=1 Tax=Polarella glacialis TaxID=89957 RepID=A0A813IM05_POLGL|nr:unnamed protein product [Polarella glacialis]CAE8655276.1 unnamed protein product [Polarella glacialis]
MSVTCSGPQGRTKTALHSLRHPGSRLHQRGVSLATVMDFGGRHFRSNAGPKDHDALSFPIDKYDNFISHSWRASRMAKYAALLYHTSLVPAAFAGLAAGILAFALQVQGILPPFGRSPPPFEPLPRTMWCLVMGGGTFFAILVMWARLVELAESTRGTKVSYFLDCLCINQGDAELKQLGIDSIGAYLRNSDSMLVLWAPAYFTRLWCCFELAIFMEESTDAEFKSRLQNSVAEMRPTSVGAARDLQQNTSPTEINNEVTAPARIAAVATGIQGTKNEIHDRKLIIIPVQMGVFCMACLVNGFNSLVLGRVMGLLDSDPEHIDLFWVLSMFGGCVLICRFFRRYSQDRLELSNQIAQFTVSRAECHAPEDKEFIKVVITCLYSETLNEIEGTAAFEYVVRSRVQQNVDKILGSRLQVPWRLPIAGMFLQTLLGLDEVAEIFMIPSHLADSGVRADRAARQAARSFSHVCVVHAFVYCAIVTSCLLPDCKSKLAEFASNAMFVLVTSCFLCGCAVFVSGEFQKMPALVGIPLNLILGLLLLNGPTCCNYVSCRFSLRKNQEEASSSNQEAGQENDQEPGEQESREETQREQGDCEQVLEPSEAPGRAYMNIMVPPPKAEILGNELFSEGPLPVVQPSPLPFPQSCSCCELLVDSSAK